MKFKFSLPKQLSIPIIILSVWALMAVLGPVLPLSTNAVDLTKLFHGPDWQAWLGYDELGRPLLHRLISGATVSFFVAFFVVSIAVITGTIVGTVSAYYGGWIDSILVRIFDIFLAFPGILLVIALAGVLGPGIDNLVIAMVLVGWVGYARLARAQVLSLRSRDHVDAAIALGTKPFVIMLRHLIPLISAPIIIEATFGIAAVIIGEAGLSFLGLGIQPPDASWGNMIKTGSDYMLWTSHMVLVPGIALILVVLAVNLLGDRLRDYFDVKSH